MPNRLQRPVEADQRQHQHAPSRFGRQGGIGDRCRVRDAEAVGGQRIARRQGAKRRVSSAQHSGRQYVSAGWQRNWRHVQADFAVHRPVTGDVALDAGRKGSASKCDSASAAAMRAAAGRSRRRAQLAKLARSLREGAVGFVNGNSREGRRAACCREGHRNNRTSRKNVSAVAMRAKRP
jgi:hypothetical protein